MAIWKLSAGKLQKLPDGMHGDGGNLWLQVSNKGRARSWVFRWSEPITRRERNMGLGSLETISIDEARETAREYRKLLMVGKDPLVERNGVRLDTKSAAGLAKTVADVIDEYLEAKLTWKSKSYRNAAARMLKVHVQKTIGDMPIQKVDTKVILDVVGLRDLWKRRHSSTRILQNHLQRMFKLAISVGYYHGKNPAAWADNLENILPARRDVHKTKSYPSLDYKEVGSFMKTLRACEDRSNRRKGYHPTSALWFEFMVLTASRIGEPRLATWKEFDIPNMTWNVPPEHRKTGYDGKTRRVPITRQMLAVLEEMQHRRRDPSEDALVFPSPYGSGNAPHGDKTAVHFLDLLRRGAPRIVPHGFRDTFSNWAKANGFDQRLIDLQLDHVSGSKSDQSYGRADMLEERRIMMMQWGDYCSRPAPEPVSDNVLPLPPLKDRRA